MTVIPLLSTGSIILQILVIDLLLGCDNALIIALVCRELPKTQRVKGILWGTAGAIALRVALVGGATMLLAIPYLRIAGGLFLFWIGLNLIANRQHNAEATKTQQLQQANTCNASISLPIAIRRILLADFVMSVDNAAALAGIAQEAAPENRFFLITAGLLMSVPLLIWGGQWMLACLERFPGIIWAGAMLPGWIAGVLIAGDPAITQLNLAKPSILHYAAGAAGALLVLATGAGWHYFRRQKKPPAMLSRLTDRLDPDNQR